MSKTDTAIIGGGLAGLTAAAYLARAGQTVTVFEKAHSIGGRARTESKHGFAFNLGAHALYRKGAGVQILRELDVEFSGNIAGTDNAYAIDNGVPHTLPGGFVSLLTTSLLSLPAKLEAVKLLANFPHIDAATQDHLTVREWLNCEVKQSKVNQLWMAGGKRWCKACARSRNNLPTRRCLSSARTLFVGLVLSDDGQCRRRG